MDPKQKTNYDPGIGARFKRGTKRIINKDGSFNVDKRGARFKISDAYLFFINLTWFQFIGMLVAGYVVINIVFALIYYGLGTEALSTQAADSNWDFLLECYYFSTQTFTTVGYGAISPVSSAASLVASFEALFGFL